MSSTSQAYEDAHSSMEREVIMEMSPALIQATTASHRVRQALWRFPLFAFFALAYAIKWILLLPYTLAAWGIIAGDWSVSFVLATFAPFVAGIIMVNLVEGRAGLTRVRASVCDWRVGWRWSLFIFAALPVLVMLGILIQSGAFAGFNGLSLALLVAYPLAYLAVWFGGGGLNEEVGWRGFALPRMQPRYGPLWGTLLLGVAHCFWHLPEFLTPAQGGGPGTGWTPFLINLPLFLLLGLAFSIVMTWLFNRTGGSLFAAISAHASVDTPQAAVVQLFPAVGVTSMLVGGAIGPGVVALPILLLTRGRLGYRGTVADAPDMAAASGR
jgi:membrane protease YdiL (CAAX protease family)